MKTYIVNTQDNCTDELETLEEAENIFEYWKDSLMSDNVVAGESFVELAESEDGFEEYNIVKKVVAAIDDDRTELKTPREEGFDWDYWAKWEDVTE